MAKIFFSFCALWYYFLNPEWPVLVENYVVAIVDFEKCFTLRWNNSNKKKSEYMENYERLTYFPTGKLFN